MSCVADRRKRHMTRSVDSISDVFDMRPNEIDASDIARLNLLCARGLPGAEKLDIDDCLRTLESWTQSVHRYVADCLPQFENNPASYQNHEGFFRFLCM